METPQDPHAEAAPPDSAGAPAEGAPGLAEWGGAAGGERPGGSRGREGPGQGRRGSRIPRRRAPAQTRLAQGPTSGRGGAQSPEGPDPQSWPAHRLRGGSLPEHRRVLEGRARDDDADGPRRRVHAPPAASAPSRPSSRPPRPIRTSPSTSAAPSPRLGLAYVVITSVDRDDLRRRRLGPLREPASARCARARRGRWIETLIARLPGREPRHADGGRPTSRPQRRGRRAPAAQASATRAAPSSAPWRPCAAPSGSTPKRLHQVLLDGGARRDHEEIEQSLVAPARRRASISSPWASTCGRRPITRPCVST
jgi:hypothetical protein